MEQWPVWFWLDYKLVVFENLASTVDEFLVPLDFHDNLLLLLEHPELMQRPVIFRGERAVIARPSEKVLELLD